MLDWRGIIGLAVAGLLVVMGINPSQFLRPGLSQSLLPVIFLFAGLSLLLISIWICRMSLRASYIVKTTIPQLGVLSVQNKDYAANRYLATFSLGNKTWQLNLERASQFAGQTIQEARMWLDPVTEEPLLVRVKGHMLPVTPKLALTPKMKTA